MALFLLALAGELDDQDGVLGGQADQDDEADLGQDVVVQPHEIDPGDRGQKAHRHDQHHGQRHGHALIERREQEEDEHHGQDENQRPGVSRRLLLIGEFRPFVVEARRQGLLGDGLHRLDRLAGGVSGGRIGLQLGGGIELIAEDAVWAGDALDVRHGGQRHHGAAGGPRLQLPDLRFVLAERRVGLGEDLIGMVQIVEIVDVARPQIGLQGVEHRAVRHAEILGLDPVYIGEDPRGLGVEGHEGVADARHCRAGRRPCSARPVRASCSPPSRCGPRPDHLDAALGADATNRRRRQEAHELAPGMRGQGLLQPAGMMSVSVTWCLCRSSKELSA